MRIFFSLILFTHLAILANSQVNLTSGLVAYYPFSGDANDQSGNGNNPIFNNAILTADRYGNPNSAYQFDGSSSYIEIPNSSSLTPTSGITLYAIVKPMGFYTGNCKNNRIIDKGSSDYLSGTYNLTFSSAAWSNADCSSTDQTHQNFYGIIYNNVGPPSLIYFTPFIQPSTYYCVALTYDGSTVKLYEDGVLKYSYASSSGIGSQSENIFIGKKNNVTYPYWFNGVIDEIRIYNRAINDQEVTALCSVSAPSSPTLTPTQPSCTVATGSIDITAPVGANYQYSIGGAFQSSPTFSGLAAGPYNVVVKDISTGAVSQPSSISISAAPTKPATPSVSLTQPDCSSTSGSISVTAPLGGNLQYSIGAAYQAATLFTGVATGSYSVTVKDLTSGCISSVTTAVINTAPNVPATPATSVTQPSCGGSTGTITITAPLGANIQYSIGGAFQGSVTFVGVPVGNYTVTAKDINSGCISGGVPVSIAAPASVPAPVTTLVQPSCTIGSGTITIIAPLGVNYQYSIGGTYQASNSFTGLPMATYPVTVKDITSGCISSVVNQTINPAPPTPPIATFSITQPTCTTDGTITITSPIGGVFTYGINGGPLQFSPTFTNLPPNSYSLNVSNGSCISSTNAVIVAAVPPAPVVSVNAQPTCTTPTGTITINSPTGANIEYSLGGAYQVSPIFMGLTPATYLPRARNTTTGCVSPLTSTTINAVPSAPSTPLGTVTQPTCVSGTGSITITSPAGANFMYSSGGPYQAGAAFNGLAPGFYNITAKDVNTGCASAITSFTVDNTPPPLIVAAISGPASLCLNDNSPHQYDDITPDGTWSSSNTAVATVDNSGLVTTHAEGQATIKYSVTNGSCTNFASKLVNVYAIHVDLYALPNPVATGTLVTLNASVSASSPNSIVAWLPKSLFTDQTAGSQVITPTATTTYSVVGMLQQGCKDTASITVKTYDADEIYIPNAFSPNADGNNDLWLIYGDNIVTADIAIFNQWGEMIFSTSDKSKGWDGISKGKPQPMGVYVYVVKVVLKNEHTIQRHGSITLVR